MHTRSFSPHTPIGERCSHAVIHHDGRPDNLWCSEVSEFAREMSDLYLNNLDPRLTDTQHADYRGALGILMRRAVLGGVKLAGRAPDGKVIDRTHFVIELRPQIRSTTVFGRPVPQLRLYLAEPQAPTGMLLGLKVAAKASDESGYDEQDEAINEAQDRAYAWSHGDYDQPPQIELEEAN